MSHHFACPSFHSTSMSRRARARRRRAGPARADDAEAAAAQKRSRRHRIKPRAKSVIFLFQWGGPSHIDMFDMKPDAPEGIRGPHKPIASKADGIQVCEQLPKTAQIMDKVTLIRTMHHTMKNHNSAGYYALTGHAPPTDDQRLRDSLDLFPGYGSVVDKLAPMRWRDADVVSYPHVIQRRLGHAGPARELPRQGARSAARLAGPEPPELRLPELSLPDGISVRAAAGAARVAEARRSAGAAARLLGRGARPRRLLREGDRDAAIAEAARGVRSLRGAGEGARRVRPHDLRPELPARAAAGRGGDEVRHRLFLDNSSAARAPNAAAGTRTASTTRGCSRSSRSIISRSPSRRCRRCSIDLEERGLLDDTLVVWMGEFGRTPKINDNVSRDHWPQCYTALLAGGGVKRGFVYGASDKTGRLSRGKSGPPRRSRRDDLLPARDRPAHGGAHRRRPARADRGRQAVTEVFA